MQFLKYIHNNNFFENLFQLSQTYKTRKKSLNQIFLY